VGGADGHLWWNYWDQATDQWVWEDHGTPPGTALTTEIEVDLDTPGGPVDISTPGALLDFGTPGALFNSADAGLKFMILTDNGHIFERYWDPATSSWGWTDHGTPSGTTVAGDPSCMLDSPATGIKFFVIGADGHVWENYWNQSARQWLWTDHETPPVVSLGLIEQQQQESEWCWLATTVSVTLYYDPASAWTQCSLANAMLGQTTCCNDGGSNSCNQPGYANQALMTTGHFASPPGGKPSLQTLMNQIEAGHPVSVNLQWNGGGGHNPAIDGYDNVDPTAPTIDVEDPIWGKSTQDFNTFPAHYQGGATWYESYFTE